MIIGLDVIYNTVFESSDNWFGITVRWIITVIVSKFVLLGIE